MRSLFLCVCVCVCVRGVRCGNINWLRRLQCNECKAPKPGSVDETREGRGGGYNERENVEYKDRAESDSEYDEFGRKKKKPKVVREHTTATAD